MNCNMSPGADARREVLLERRYHEMHRCAVVLRNRLMSLDEASGAVVEGLRVALEDVEREKQNILREVAEIENRLLEP